MNRDDQLATAKCDDCGNETARANLSSCPVCETFNNACPECTDEHRHSAEEIEAARAEALA